MRDARCDLCRFWMKDGDTPRHYVHPDDQEGECHRHAPSPRSFDFHRETLKHLSTLAWHVSNEEERKENFEDWEEAASSGTTTWPITEGDEWCGEFLRGAEP